MEFIVSPGFLLFTSKIGVCTYLDAVKSNNPSSHEQYSQKKKVFIKSKVVKNDGTVGFWMSWLNHDSKIKNMVLCGTVPKSVSAVEFWTSPRRFYCHCDHFHKKVYCKN